MTGTRHCPTCKAGKHILQSWCVGVGGDGGVEFGVCMHSIKLLIFLEEFNVTEFNHSVCNDTMIIIRNDDNISKKNHHKIN